MAARVILTTGLFVIALMSVALAAYTPTRLNHVDEPNDSEDSLDESIEKLEARLGLRKSLVELLRQVLGEEKDAKKVDGKGYERVKYAGWRPTEMLYTKGKWGS